MFTIAFDFDGVLNDLPVKWSTYLNKKYNINNVDPYNLPYYDMNLNYPTLSTSQIFETLNDAKLWDTVENTIDLKEVMSTIDSAIGKSNYIIVTATDVSHWYTKYNHCVRRILPDFPTKDIILTCHKDLVKYDILIDDFIENLTCTDSLGVLINAPYNKHSKINNKIMRSDISRISNSIIQQLKENYHGTKNANKTRYSN